MKLGGDKGRGSFKLNLQLVNTPEPNSCKNTSLIAVYKAGDSSVNLHIALDQYREDIKAIQGMMWQYVRTYINVHKVICTHIKCREWKVRVFISGDYEFLCLIYGLSGASGR